MIPAYALPYVIGGGLAIAAIGGGWAWGEHREAQGAATERAAWEQETARLRAVAAESAVAAMRAVMAADDAARASRASLDAIEADTRKEADAYYRAHPVARRACLDPVRLQAIAASDSAATAAAKAAK